MTVPKNSYQTNERGKFLVNVTDKLRFRMDINTDDELEDLSAEMNYVTSAPVLNP